MPYISLPPRPTGTKGAQSHLALFFLLEHVHDIGRRYDGDVFHHKKDLRLVQFLEHLGQLGAEPAKGHLVRHHPRTGDKAFPLGAVRVAAGGEFHHVVE